MTSPRPSGALQRFERELLAWVVAWAPYGGAPDDETFPEFGLSTSEATDRAARLVCQRLSGELSTAQADRVLVTRAGVALRGAGMSTLSGQAPVAMHPTPVNALAHCDRVSRHHTYVVSERISEGGNHVQTPELAHRPH